MQMLLHAKKRPANREQREAVLAWYERQPRAVLWEEISRIPWDEVRKHALPKELLRVLVYMRDVESLTPVYARELVSTPSWRDPVTRRFLERWQLEERQHGELIGRFLADAGVPSSPSPPHAGGNTWRRPERIAAHLRWLGSEPLIATHMAWGAINELSTIAGYERLSQLASHPVLTHILRLITREEAIHAGFYLRMAEVRLRDSAVARHVAPPLVGALWRPVGRGKTSQLDTEHTVKTLFGDRAQVEWFDRRVTVPIQKLPGFSVFNVPTVRIASIVGSGGWLDSGRRASPAWGREVNLPGPTRRTR